MKQVDINYDHKTFNNTYPSYLKNYIKIDEHYKHNTRSSPCFTTVKSLLFMGVPIFVVFVGRLIHEVKNTTYNETCEAV